MCLLFYLNCTPGIFAQSVTNYTFSTSGGTFTPLVSGSTNPGEGQTDDGAWNSNPIGFNFWYMGTRYTMISASTNGWLAFGTTISSYGHVNSLTSTAPTNATTIRPILAPLWDDLAISNISDFSHQTSGTVGNRIFTAEYLNEEWQYPATSPAISFQVKLYEGTGKIEFIYKSESGPLHTPSASIGITGNETGTFLSLNGTGINPTVSSIIETNDLSTKPADGQIYTFTPPIPETPVGLNFSNVTSSSMTLNWIDNSSNEVGFVIYRSSDNGETYEFVTQTAANETSSQQLELLSSSVYFWKVYAVSEGALSINSISGSQETNACGNPVAKTWIGAGNGGSGTDFSQNANWNPAGQPTCADSLIISITGNATISLSSSIEVGAINASISGANKVFELNTGANTLQINQSANFKISSGNNNTQIRINTGNGGGIVYNKSATFSAASGTNLPIYGNGGTSGIIQFRGNVNFESGCSTNAIDQPDKIIFDADGTQTITFNNTSSTVFLGKLATEIGSKNNPTVIITGSASGTPVGDLNINGTSVLDLSTKRFNRNGSGGSVNLATGSTLKLGASAGGQAGSNFPSNFTSFAFDAGSNVIYNAANGVNQTIYAVPTYGNLKLANSTGSGSSIKTAAANLSVLGDFVINDAFTTFNAGTSLNHSLGGDWINNGATSSGSFIYTTSNTITFNGTLPQQIQGSAATTFHNLSLNNLSGLELSQSTGLITNITNTLALTNGKVTLSDCELGIGANTISGSISGYNSSNYIITNGTGTLNQYNIGTGQRTNVVYPIGISSSSYTPITLNVASSTIVDNFKAAVRPNVMVDGVTGERYASGVIDRTWDVTEGISGGSNVTLTVQWYASDELEDFDRASCTLSHYTSGAWTDTTTKGAAGQGPPYTSISGVVSSFSPFAMTSSPGLLPIELVRFNGRCNKNKVVLEWQTATEINNDYFTIDKSFDARNFKAIGEVDGAGSSMGLKKYEFTDVHPHTKTAYYRLKQTDFDGQHIYSNIILLNRCNIAEAEIINVYNDSGVLTINVYSDNSQKCDIFIYNASGHKVLGSELHLLKENNEINLTSSAISEGLYLIVLKGENTLIGRKIIIK